MGAIVDIINTVSNAPLPLMIEKLGMSIAHAQAALDENSIKMANAMAEENFSINGENYSLIALGFAPTFYAFTEASIEIKMEFSMAETEDYGAKLTIGGGKGKSSNKDGEKSHTMFGASLTAHYNRKFEQSAEGSSSIAARIISLPVPDTYHEILRKITNNKEE